MLQMFLCESGDANGAWKLRMVFFVLEFCEILLNIWDDGILSFGLNRFKKQNENFLVSI